MANTKIVRKYAWVVDLLQRRKRLTLEDFNDEWNRSSLSECFARDPDRRTWYTCFEEISSIYGIIIRTAKGRGSFWHIANPEDLKGRGIQEWMLSSVVHRNLMEECLGMHNRIQIEGFPSENGRLKIITMAMREYRKLKVVYRKYDGKQKTHIIEPLLLKTYEHRFYVLCKYETGQCRTLSFDRIVEAEMLKEHFNYSNDLFAQLYYEHCYGVMIPPDGDVPVDIVVRAKGDAKYYLIDKPLHKSQRIIREEKGYTDFMVHIFATNDFLGAIMHQGDRLEIMSPENVRNRIKDMLGNAYHQYLSA